LWPIKEDVMKGTGMAFVILAMMLAVSPAAASILAWAPATGANFTNNQTDDAVVEARGHIVYSTTSLPTPPYPPGMVSYAWNTHDSSACGNSYCDNVSVFYYRHKCVSGGGTSMDSLEVTFHWDLRVYAGTGTFYSAHTGPNYSDERTLTYDDQVYQFSWNGGTSGIVSNQSVTYKVGVWQGSAGGWSATTSTGAL